MGYFKAITHAKYWFLHRSVNDIKVVIYFEFRG